MPDRAMPDTAPISTRSGTASQWAQLQAGMSTDPIRSKWQGVARLSDALFGSLALQRASQQGAAGATANAERITTYYYKVSCKYSRSVRLSASESSQSPAESRLRRTELVDFDLTQLEQQAAQPLSSTCAVPLHAESRCGTRRLFWSRRRFCLSLDQDPSVRPLAGRICFLFTSRKISKSQGSGNRIE
jgi:hypothetical protein